MESIEIEGKTVAEAVEKALSRLGLRRDQVEVQTLQEASAGFMGLGAKPARVRVTQKIWGEPSAAGSQSKPAPTRKPILKENPEKAPPPEEIQR
jgi:spoIIIJ-associated protein